jgi:alginate O-acetyltransferase complex protein AlgI
MIFLNYDFVWFALSFFPLYFAVRWPRARLTLLVGSGILFQSYFGGWLSVGSVAVLTVVTFLACRVGGRRANTVAIVVCVAMLLFYKYTAFMVATVADIFSPEAGARLSASAAAALPATIPLGISFFTFEFVHYLVDVRRGNAPIRKLREFLGFAFFWPTMVSGPIKRYEQFIPSLFEGLSTPTATGVTMGLVRLAVGVSKKWMADNLSGWIDYIEPQFGSQSLTLRWLFLVALAFRILLDFSGYSDMAIGFAGMMGITVPENFNWPYIARSPMEFWQRWHISLSTWIRDYIYIPLGGNRLGVPRKIFNALTAMVLCGLWHGHAWNFAVWGLYHGIGLSIGAVLKARLMPAVKSLSAVAAANGAVQNATYNLRLVARILLSGLITSFSWAATMFFVCIGWLLFFYPVDRAATMALQLFVR